MTEWIYRATETGTDEQTTAELLDLGFLWAQVCRKGGSAMPRVPEVCAGDPIHMIYKRKDGSIESLGTFRVTDAALDGTTTLPTSVTFASLQRAVVPGSDLDVALAHAGYKHDPHLRAFTGWVIEPIEPTLGTVPQRLFANRGQNSLFEFDSKASTLLVKTQRAAPRGKRVAPTNQPAPVRTPARGGTSASSLASVASSVAGTASPWVATPGARAVGLDWSGSKKAGKKIWQAHLEVNAASKITLLRLDQPFLQRPDKSGVRAEFARWFAGLGASVVGMDFCFGLERRHARQVCAAAGVAAGPSLDPTLLGSVFAKILPNPDALRSTCAPERKRETDLQSRSPFAPTNLRMYRQTWLGLLCLGTLPNPDIAPWKSGAASVIVEVLPASVARALGSDGGYKGRSREALAGRERLATAIETIVVVQPADRQRLVDDIEGDAIDAVLAGLAALRAHQRGFPPPPGPVLDEGWIY
jgi:Protein of unknown function (DUF429)